MPTKKLSINSNETDPKNFGAFESISTKFELDEKVDSQKSSQESKELRHAEDSLTFYKSRENEMLRRIFNLPVQSQKLEPISQGNQNSKLGRKLLNLNRGRTPQKIAEFGDSLLQTRIMPNSSEIQVPLIGAHSPSIFCSFYSRIGGVEPVHKNPSLELQNLSSCNSNSAQDSKHKEIQGRRGPYKMFSYEMRIEVLNFMKSKGLKKASIKYGINKKRLLRWIKNGPERKKGAGRKTLDPEMENLLVEWIRQEVANHNVFPTRQAIKIKAREISKVESFRASKGWCDKFFRRNHKTISQIRTGLIPDAKIENEDIEMLISEDK